MQNRYLKVFLIVLLVGLLIVSAVSYYFLSYSKKNTTETTNNVVVTPTASPTPTPEPEPVSLNLRMLYFGDIFWGRYVNDWSMKSPLKYAYPFSGLNTLDRESYNAWIGSLDCPITDKIIDSATMDATLTFNCLPEYLPEASKWITATNLANSHTSNMNGAVGFQTTRTNLDKYGIQYFGHYDKNVKEEICEVMSFDTFETYSDKDYVSPNQYRIPIAICGYHDTFSLPTEEQLDVITEYAKYFPTIAYGIQGSEYNTTADQLQEKYMRKMIDKGADAMIGKGAHVVQNSESYNGKLIFYSVGNFIFDQQVEEKVRSGAAVSVDMTMNYDENLKQYSLLAEQCKVFKDQCLEKAKALNLVKPKFTVKYDVIPTDNSNKLVKKAGDAIRNIVLKRATWETTLPKLKTEL